MLMKKKLGTNIKVGWAGQDRRKEDMTRHSMLLWLLLFFLVVVTVL